MGLRRLLPTSRQVVRLLLLSALAAAGVAAGIGLPGTGNGGASAAVADLAAQWHLDEIQGPNARNRTTPDSSGNGLTASVVGPTLVAGRFANALEFSSENQSAVFVPKPGAVLEPQSVTVLAWVKHSGSPGTFRYVVAKGARDCSAASYALYTGASGGLAFYVDDGASARVSPDAGSGVWDGSWHMVAGTFDGSTVRLYVDGVQVGSGTPAHTSIAYGAADASSDLFLGNYPDTSCGSSFGWSGDLDEVRVYSRALTDAELDYLGTATGPNPPDLPPPTTTTTTTTSSGPSGPPAPIPVVKTLTPQAAKEAIFDASATQPNGTTIKGYDYHLAAGGNTFQFSCGASTPIASAVFSGAVSGTATVTARAVGSGAASTTIPFAAAAAQQPARSLAGASGSGVMIAHTCSSKPIGVISKASLIPKPPSFCPRKRTSAIAADTTTRVVTGLIDAEMCTVVQATSPDALPPAEAAMVKKYLRNDGQSGKGGDAFYITTTSARINGLIVVPNPGAAIVLAVAGGNDADFLNANTAFLLSSSATIYFTANGATQTVADLSVSSNTAVPLNWNFNLGHLGAGAPVDLDVGQVPYCHYAGTCSDALRTQVKVATLDVFHLANGLGFPAIPIKGVRLEGSLDVYFKADSSVGPDPFTQLADLKLTIPLSSAPTDGPPTSAGASITGEVDIKADNDNGTYLDKLVFSFNKGSGGFLDSIPLDSLSLAYYNSQGSDDPDVASSQCNKPENAELCHPAKSLVGTARVDFSKVPPLKGTLDARLVISQGSTWSLDATLHTNQQIFSAGAPDTGVFLTRAELRFDSATGVLTGSARLAAPGVVGAADGCGLAGENGVITITFPTGDASKPFDINATGNSEFFCQPAGQEFGFDLKVFGANSVALTFHGGLLYDISTPLGLNFSLGGDAAGSMNLSRDGTWHVQLDGQETGKVDIPLPDGSHIDGTFTGHAVLSDKGIGVCVDVGGSLNVLGANYKADVDPGFGFTWNNQTEFLTALGVGTTAPELAAAYVAARLVAGDHYTDHCQIQKYQSIAWVPVIGQQPPKRASASPKGILSSAETTAPGRASALRATIARGALRLRFDPAPLALGQIVTVRLSDGENLSFGVGGRTTSVIVPGMPRGTRVIAAAVRGQRNGTYGPAVTYIPTNTSRQ